MHAQSSRMLDPVPHKWFTILYERLPGIVRALLSGKVFSQYTYNYIARILRIPRLALAPIISSNLLSRTIVVFSDLISHFSFKNGEPVPISGKASWRYSWRSFATRCVRWISFPLEYHLNLFHERFAHSKTFALSMEYYVISTFFGK